MNILLVDNTPLYRDILHQSFGRCRGVQLQLVTTLAEAMAAARTQSFDFFVLAWQLTDGGGVDLARQLRESGHAPVAPIVLLTASPTAELAQQAMLSGVTELFRKQDVEELITFMRHFLDANQPLLSRVLYIEDARDQREFLAAQLREWGLTVDGFSSADDAWQAFLRNDYDLLLSDIHLGGHMSGARLINRIRRQGLPKGGTPILAVTAYDDPTRRLELFHLGIDDYVLKPVIPVELRARLHNLLTRKRATERNQQLLAASSFGVSVVDEEGFVRSMDANALSMFGVSEAMLAANSARTLLGEPADEIMRLLLSGVALSKRRLTARHFNGDDLAIELSTLEIEPANGWRQFALLTRDISKELELANTLLRAKEAAEYASRVKAEFLANMSHEIRTPLNAIIGMAYLMKRNGLAPDQLERAERIDSAGQHLLGIINDVLDISKIEAGKLGLESIPLSIGTIVSNVASMVNERATAKGLNIQVEAVPFSQPLMGDPTRLTQALLNYLSNAVKFTEHGTITLRTRIQEQGEDNLSVRFEVIDSGVGIDPHALNHIFDAFQQADNSTTRKFGGTGLGLAITRELARLMGGEAGVSSELGKGSNFWFSARLKRGSANGKPLENMPVRSAEDVLINNFKGTRILLVEDDFINREVALELLSDMQFEIDVAEDGLVALNKIQRNNYALVLMDMQMPRMDGLEATRCIRALDARKQLPIIAMTANAFAEDKQRCLEAGMDDFIAKPIDPDTLFVTILRWLSANKLNVPA
jgi:CheY-like chemotaxis protein